MVGWTKRKRRNTRPAAPKATVGNEVISDFRAIFNLKETPQKALQKIQNWCSYALNQAPKVFQTTVHTIKNIHTIGGFISATVPLIPSPNLSAQRSNYSPLSKRGIQDPLFIHLPSLQSIRLIPQSHEIRTDPGAFRFESSKNLGYLCSQSCKGFRRLKPHLR